jgi:16S rRNA (guanine1207-N2)-methyltransferase
MGLQKAMSRLEYYDVKEFSTTLRNQQVRFCSKRGIANWHRITAGARLLADVIQTSPQSRILLLGCGHGALGVAFSHLVPQGDVVLLDTSYIAMKAAEMTININSISNVSIWPGVSLFPSNTEAFRTVAMLLPKGRKFMRRWLFEAFLALQTGGRLWLAGPTQEGVKSAIADARALFGNAETVGYRGGERVAVAVKIGREPNAEGWAREAGILPGTWHEFEANLRGLHMRFRTLPNIFSYDRVDAGTTLLIQNMEISHHAKVLDIGCGYGIIGIIASRMGASHVDLIDSDLYSIAAARENIIINKALNTEAFPSDLFDAVSDRKYDIILSNPPFHTGKATDFSMISTMIAEARQILKPGGKLIIVSNKFLGYSHLMGASFEKVTCLHDTPNYVVLSGELSSVSPQ